MPELVERVTRTDGTAGLRVHLHAGQQRAWDSPRRFVFVLAGSQSGKTSFGPWWLHREIEARGPGDYLAATATYDLFKLKMLPEMKRLFCEYLADEGWEWEASDRIIASRPWNVRIILRSADAEGGLESATALAAWLDECGQDRFRLEAWEAVQRRLALAQGRALGTTTPYNLGWLKREVYDRWKAGDRDFDVVQFPSTMNPLFPQSEYDRLKARLAPWKSAMFLDGGFGKPAGLIYGECFSDEENVVDDFQIPRDWPRRLGLDFGGVNTAGLWLAEDTATGVHYVYREYHEGGRTSVEHVAAMNTFSLGENLVLAIGGAPSEDQQRRDFGASGLTVQRPKIVDVEAGIDRVYAGFKTRTVRVFKSCRKLLDEVGTYSREVGDDGEPIEKIKDKSTFHLLDALRYVGTTIGGVVKKPREARSYQG